MPTPSAKLLAVLFAGAVTVAVAAFSACSETDGITPDCIYNIDEAGVIQNVADACVQFATCPNDAGVNDPTLCCVDADGGPLTGSDLANCLYGYGACPNIETDEAGNTTCSGGAGGGGTGGSSPDGGGTDGGDGG